MVIKQDLEGRLKRARSWIEASKTFSDDEKHAEFVCLYIALNAMYGRRQYEGSKEDALKDREEFLKRIRKIHDYDVRFSANILKKALQDCRKEAGSLITNYFLRNSYWKRAKRSDELLQQFARLRQRAETRLDQGNYEDFLCLVLERLTVLRNQVMHGCVTYGRASKGLPSLEDGLAVLRKLVPAFCNLMEQYGQKVDWPSIPYPRVGSESHPSIDQVR